jgi:protocatechuate 3,4-dioxygenase beta subunit
MTKLGWTRRQFVLASSTIVPVASNARAKDECGVYVEADSGPFYPVGRVPFVADLTTGPAGDRAGGQVLYVFGHVTDGACSPVAGAEILIWQADMHGQYNHPNAEKSVELDPNFSYYARVRSNEEGFYVFKTIVPQWYNFQGLRRAAHIHFGMKHRDGREALSEMYFAGKEHDDRRNTDVVWKSRNSKTRHHMIMKLQSPEEFTALDIKFEPGSLCCRHDLQIV